MAKRYLVIIVDDGDTDSILVDEKAYNWIFKDPPNTGKSSWKETVPGTKERVIVSVGSPENDRALALMSHADMVYNTISEAVKACYGAGDELVDDYVGLSY